MRPAGHHPRWTLYPQVRISPFCSTLLVQYLRNCWVFDLLLFRKFLMFPQGSNSRPFCCFEVELAPWTSKPPRHMSPACEMGASLLAFISPAACDANHISQVMVVYTRRCHVRFILSYLSSWGTSITPYFFFFQGRRFKKFNESDHGVSRDNAGLHAHNITCCLHYYSHSHHYYSTYTNGSWFVLCLLMEPYKQRMNWLIIDKRGQCDADIYNLLSNPPTAVTYSIGIIVM